MTGLADRFDEFEADPELRRTRARDALFDWSRPQPELRGYTIGMLMASEKTPAHLVAEYQAACDASGKGIYA